MFSFVLWYFFKLDVFLAGILICLQLWDILKAKHMLKKGNDFFSNHVRQSVIYLKEHTMTGE